MLLAAGALTSSFGPMGAVTTSIDCDKGKSVQTALDKARDGSDIVLGGTCPENIVVRGNRILLIADGAGVNLTSATAG